jgi:hypothetical protein
VPTAEAGAGTKAKASRYAIGRIEGHDAGHAHDATIASLIQGKTRAHDGLRFSLVPPPVRKDHRS